MDLCTLHTEKNSSLELDPKIAISINSSTIKKKKAFKTLIYNVYSLHTTSLASFFLLRESKSTTRPIFGTKRKVLKSSKRRY